MGKNIKDTGLGIFTGGITIVVSYFAGLTTLEIATWSIVVGLLFFLIGHFWEKIIILIRRIKSEVILVFHVVTHLNESYSYLILKNEQQNKPENWLYPITEYIDLNRQGSAHNDNDVYIGFSIDSHLLFPIKEFKLFMKLCIKTAECLENESGWYQVRQSQLGNPTPPLDSLALKSINDKISVEGVTDGENVLLRWMNDFRNGKPLLAMLKIGITLRDDEKPVCLEHNYWIAPMNDTGLRS